MALSPIDGRLILRRDGTPDVAVIAAAVRDCEPEYVAASREALLAEAERFRARRDVERYREWLRAARLWEWHMAQRWPANPSGAHRKDDRPPLTAVKGEDYVHWQHVYAVGRAQIESIKLALAIEDLVQRAFRSPDAHVGANTGVPEWYTPGFIIDAARDVLGAIDLDPASSEIANRTVQAAHYFTVDEDGLAQPWKGRVFMNPPYTTGLVDRFAAKLLDEHRLGNVPAAIVLTNNSTDTEWWQALAGEATALCFPAGRVRFLAPDGEPGAPLQGQAICYLGPNITEFCQRFSEIGVVSS